MNTVVKVQSEPPVESSDSRTIMSIIDRVMANPEFDLDRIEKLLALKERWEAGEAKKAFVEAMANFKADPPTILKDKHVSYTSERTGKTTEYNHATLGAMCDAIVKGLAKVGISHRWTFEQAEGMAKVTCVLTHRMGHSESVSLSGPYDDSGGKNAIQSVSSATTYLERYTLFAATGLAAQEDDDGRGTQPVETITEAQAKTLKEMILDGRKTGEEKIMADALRYMKLKALTDLPAKNFESVKKDLAAINSARKRAGGAK